MIIPIIYASMFLAVMLFTYGMLSMRFQNYEISLSRYRRKRLGLLLFATPFITASAGILKRFFGDDNRFVRRMRRRLVGAGKDTSLSAEEFVALQWLLGAAAAVVGVLAVLVYIAFIGRETDLASGVLFVLILSVAAFLAPVMPIDNAAAARRRSILNEWPFFLDLLTLALESGMDMSMAAQRIIANVPLSPLMEELMRFLNEIKLGARRSDALKAMAERIDVPPITATIEMMVQAEELGTELGPLMRIQAHEFRDRQAQYVEQLAIEAPVKMLFPLLVCIFPAILVVLLGPVMIQYFISR